MDPMLFQFCFVLCFGVYVASAGEHHDNHIAQLTTRLAPIPLARLAQTHREPDYSGPPTPYQFAYDSTDEFGTRLHREESGDAAGTKRGSYGYAEGNGIYRTVSYVADASGYRATVKTNEPGTISGPIGDAVIESNAINSVPSENIVSGAPHRLVAPALARSLPVHIHHE